MGPEEKPVSIARCEKPQRLTHSQSIADAESLELNLQESITIPGVNDSVLLLEVSRFCAHG